MIASYSAITDDEVVRLHEAALYLLSKMGMVIKNEKAIQQLAQFGAIVSKSEQVVKFPERMIHELIGLAPSFYTLGGRSSEYDLDLTLNSGLTRPIVGCNRIYDDSTKRRIEPTTEDMVRAAILVDALPNYDWNAAFIYGGNEPPHIADIYYFKLLLENTQKHICISPYGASNVEFMIEMAVAVQGSKDELAKRPIFNLPVSPVSPLVYSEKFSDIIMILAKARVPIMMGSTPIGGGTGPVTFAGSVVLMHAENLVGLMLAEATNPGAPVYFGPRPSPMEMRSGISLWGSIDWSNASTAGVQLARWCGLPGDILGLGTESKLPDQQSGIERAMRVILAAISAPSIISGGGFIDTISTGSLEQLVIDDEVIAMARHVTKGIKVDNEHIAMDVIQEVGFGDTYLSEEHTRDYFRQEFFQAKLADQASYGTWEELGAKDIVVRAQEQVENILDKHEVPSLSDPIHQELENIYNAAKHELADI
jgi:trimethylamine--corrinoid protein Co-methyltransferase